MAKKIPIIESPFRRPFPEVELTARKVPGGFATVQQFINIWKTHKYAGMIFAIQECAYQVRMSLPQFRKPSKPEQAMRGANTLLFLVEDDFDMLNEAGFELDYDVLQELLDFLSDEQVEKIKASAPFRKIVANCKNIVSRFGVEMFYYVIYVANAVAVTQALPVTDDEAMVAAAVAVELDLLWTKFLSFGSGGPPPPPGTVIH